MFGKKVVDAPIDCDAVHTHLERYLDGRFPPDTLAAFDDHLAGCANCRRLVREEPDWLNQLRYEPPPARLSAEETAVMRQQLYRRMKRKMFIRHTITVFQTAFALLLLALAVGLIAWWQGGDNWGPLAGPWSDEATITLAAPASFQTGYKLLIDEFQREHPHILVRFVPLSPEQDEAGLSQQAALADVILLEGTPPPTAAAAAFLDLAPLLDADPAFDTADFWPGLLDACQSAGVQVGLPFRANASLIFYDKAAFDAAGLPHPQPGWRWEDFQQAVQVLGTGTTRYGFTDGGTPLSLLAPLADNMIVQSGDRLHGRDLADALDWYVALVAENAILSQRDTPVNNLLAERQVGMWIGSHLGLLGANAALGDDLGVVPFPTAAGLNQSNPATAGCALISAETNQSQAAWTFLDYLSWQDIFTTGYYPAAPARRSVAQRSDYWGQMEPDAAVALQAALEQGWYRRAEMPELVTVGHALTEALAGNGSLAANLPANLARALAVQPPAQPPASGSDPVTSDTLPPVLPLDPDVVVIEYSVRGHDDWETVMALAAAFNDSQPRIRVNATTRQPLPAGGSLLEQAAAFDCFVSGTRPDVAYAQLGDPFLEAFYSLGPLFSAEDPAFRRDFTFMSGYLSASRLGGELYALPLALNPVVLRYNAALLAQRGLDPPAADWTTEDFWALVQAASSGPAYGLVAVEGILPEELLAFVPGVALYFDGDTRPREPRFTDPAVVDALEFLGRMAAAGVLYPDTAWASRRTVTEDLAVSGQASSTVSLGRTAVWGYPVGAGDVGGSRAASTVVAYPQGALPNLSGIEGSGQPMMLYISRRSSDPTACWQWAKFLSAQPALFAGIPARQSVRESAEWRQSVGEETAVVYETTYTRPPEWELNMGWETVVYRTWWADALLSVYQGEDAARALARAQRRAETFYDCYAPLARHSFPDLLPFTQVQECARQADPDYRR
jgi:ABC-type glycerol-3-phosphate transport system substrate-binding protein